MTDVSQAFASAIQSDSCQGLQKLAKKLVHHVSKHSDQSSKISARALRACLAPEDAISIPKVAAFLGQILAQVAAPPCAAPASTPSRQSVGSPSGPVTEPWVQELFASLCDLCSHREAFVRVRALGFIHSALRGMPPPIAAAALFGVDELEDENDAVLSGASLLEALTQRLDDKDAKARRAAVIALGSLIPVLQVSVGWKVQIRAPSELV